MLEALRDIITQNAAAYLALGGFLVGGLFGAIVLATNFCAMGSLSDIHNFGDWRRFRAWLLAAATALIGAQLLQAAGIVALDKSMYLAAANLNWVGHVMGGLMFGFGMVFTGGCPSRNLARAGAGDLRSLMTLIVLGLVATMAIGGILGPARAALEQTTSVALGAATPSLGDLLGKAVGVAPPTANLGIMAMLAAAALVYCFRSRAFRASPVHVVSGLGVGLLVVAGWAIGGLAFDELAAKPTPPVSLTYVRPTGDTLQWLMLYTAGPIPSFGVASVVGALFGAFVASVAMGRFRIAAFSGSGDMLRNLLGAALMGIGGVMALGCTIGQAITGVSTLALGSFLAFAAIVAGGFLGLRMLERVA